MGMTHLKVVAGCSMSTELQGSFRVMLMVQHVVAQCASQAGACSILLQVQLVQVDEWPTHF